MSPDSPPEFHGSSRTTVISRIVPCTRATEFLNDLCLYDLREHGFTCVARKFFSWVAHDPDRMPQSRPLSFRFAHFAELHDAASEVAARKETADSRESREFGYGRPSWTQELSILVLAEPVENSITWVPGPKSSWPGPGLNVVARAESSCPGPGLNVGARAKVFVARSGVKRVCSGQALRGPVRGWTCVPGPKSSWPGPGLNVGAHPTP